MKTEKKYEVYVYDIKNNRWVKSTMLFWDKSSKTEAEKVEKTYIKLGYITKIEKS